MPVRKIYSDNADYQKLEVLKTNRVKRSRYGEFFVEGVRNINEAVKRGWHLSSLVYTAERPLSGWAVDMLEGARTDCNIELTAPLMDRLSGRADCSELIAVVKMQLDEPSRIVCGEKPLIALFDRPSNHGNLGTVIRTCDAIGADGLIITGHAVDLYDPEVIGSTMGSFFALPVIRMPSQKELEDYVLAMKEKYAGFTVVGTTSHKKRYVSELSLDCPLMLIIGNETDGMSRRMREWCDVTATIPMADSSSASSFNVACAASVLLYEAMRQRAFNKTTRSADQ